MAMANAPTPATKPKPDEDGIADSSRVDIFGGGNNASDEPSPADAAAPLFCLTKFAQDSASGALLGSIFGYAIPKGKSVRHDGKLIEESIRA